MKVFKDTGSQIANCRLLGVYVRKTEGTLGGGGHLQGKGFGPTMKDGEQVHVLHVFSKNNMFISFCDD